MLMTGRLRQRRVMLALRSLVLCEADRFVDFLGIESKRSSSLPHGAMKRPRFCRILPTGK